MQNTTNETVREPKSTLPFLVDSMLAVEKTRVRTQVRQSHLELREIIDPRTDQVLELLESVEETIDGWVAEELRKHPAYGWFSRIKGIGNENVAKVVGMIDIRKARSVSSLWKYAGYHVVNVEVAETQRRNEIEISVDALRKKLGQLNKKQKKDGAEEKELVLTPAGIEELINYVQGQLDSTIGPVLRGYAPHPEKGQKLPYNKDLRTMCFRVAGSLLKARGKYAEFYDREKNKLVSRYREQGIRIVPTLELPTNGKKIFEPVGTISSNHVHMQAMRKMMKLFLSHLWLVWREAEGLPVSEPYAFGVLGHDKHDYIGPWEMVEKPEPRARRRQTPQPEVAGA